MATLWHITLHTFAGFVTGARHYRLEITGGRYRLSVSTPMEAEEADRLNADDIARGVDPWWEAGQPTDKVTSEETALELARAVAALLVADDGPTPGGAVLRGSSASAEPQEVLAGPPPFVTAATALHTRVLELEDGDDNRDVWSLYPDAMRSICRDWDALISEHGLDLDRSFDREYLDWSMERRDGVWVRA